MSTGPAPGLDALLDRRWDQATSKDWAGVLAQLPLFSRVGRRQLRKLADLAQFEEFAPDDVVIQAGEPSDAFYLIVSGQARVLVAARARLLGTGDYFGEMGLIDGEPRSATIIAVLDLQVMKLPRPPFLKLLEQEPGIAIAMLAALADRLRRIERAFAA